MNPKTKKTITISFDPKTPLIILALIAAFLAGASWGKRGLVKKTKEGQEGSEKEHLVEFTPEKQEKTNLKLFVMSFCPFGNQAEIGLKPVAELLGDKFDFEPHYIVEKHNQEQMRQRCQSRVYNEKRCQEYVDQGYFPNLKACRQRFYTNINECLEKEGNNCLLSKDNHYYCSLHGKKELNQNIREICAWNLTEDKNKWWEFISLVNRNCQLEEVDSCWQEQAGKAGLDQDKIQQCFNEQATELLDKEVALAAKLAVSGSPTFFINDTPYPPEGAYDREGKMKTKINQEIFSQQEYRSPEALKQAICAGFKKAPKECKTELSRESKMQANRGSCN